jgi:hypothetical protein
MAKSGVAGREGEEKLDEVMCSERGQGVAFGKLQKSTNIGQSPE